MADEDLLTKAMLVGTAKGIIGDTYDPGFDPDFFNVWCDVTIQPRLIGPAENPYQIRIQNPAHPMLVALTPFVARFETGVLRAVRNPAPANDTPTTGERATQNNTPGIPLLAETPELELPEGVHLVYDVKFGQFSINGARYKFDDFTFAAPTSDVTIDISRVDRINQPPSHGEVVILRMVPDDVRLDGDGKMVFSAGGVDFPHHIDRLEGPRGFGVVALEQDPENLASAQLMVESEGGPVAAGLPIELPRGLSIVDVTPAGDGTAIQLWVESPDGTGNVPLGDPIVVTGIFNPLIFHGSDPTVARSDAAFPQFWEGDCVPDGMVDMDMLFDYSMTPPTIMTAILNGLNKDAPFSEMLVAEGTGPFYWTLVDEDTHPRPPGSTLSTAGNFFGESPTPGTYPIRVKAENPAGADIKDLTVIVGNAIKPTITTTSLGDLTTASVLNLTLAVSGSNPITITKTDGAYPVGVSFDPATRKFTGTPAIGPYSFELRAQNGAGYDTHVFSGTVAGMPPTFATGGAGTFYRAFALPDFELAGAGPITVTKVVGSYPAGVTGVTVTGTTASFVGTPSGVGTATFTLRASNPYGHTDCEFTVNIIESTPHIVETSLGTMTVGTAFHKTLTLSSGGPTITWSKLSGTLPVGVTFDPATHTFDSTGALTTAGSGTVTIRASNGVENHDVTFNWTVSPLGVSFRTGSNAGQGPSSSVTRTVTINANPGDDVFIAIATQGASTGISSVTYSLGDTVSPVPSASGGFGGTSAFGQLWVYRIHNLSASGGTLTVTMAAAVTVSVAVVAEANVSSVSGVVVAGAYATSSSQSATGVANGRILRFVAVQGGSVTGVTAGTERQNQGNVSIAEISGTGTQTITHTMSNYQSLGVIMVLNP